MRHSTATRLVSSRVRRLDSRKRRSLIIAAAVLVALLSGCTATDPPANEAKKPGTTTTTSAAPIPYKPGAEAHVEARHALRALDPCALLDPEAGATAVGGTADQLLPGPDPAECVLEVLPEGATKTVDAWTVTATVGVSFSSLDIDLGGAKPQPIPAVDDGSFYRQESYSDSDCTIVRPVDDRFGLELEVQAPLLSETPAQPPCDIAVAYLKSTVDRWMTPSSRADGLTEPTLPLAEQDPCAATAAVGEAVGAEVLAEPNDLYNCRIVVDEASSNTPAPDSKPVPTADGEPSGTTPDSSATPSQEDRASAADGVEITFLIVSDPASREPINGTESITIDGRMGSLDRSATVSCDVQVALNDTTVVHARDGERLQVVSVTASSCETATQAATAVLESLAIR